MPEKAPLVAIVGRVNVGKSTLFNRLIKKPLAVVDKKPGVTRDAIKKPVEHAGKTFLLVDTGGFFPQGEELWERVRERIEEVVRGASAVIFMVDGKEGLTPLDQEIARWLHSLGVPVVVAVNKADSKKAAPEEFYALGFERVIPVSAVRGDGVEELLDEVVKHVPEARLPKKPDKIRLAILGKPNVGKSSLLNALVGSAEAIVSDTPGTTRDPVEAQDTDFWFVDTAGIKRRFQDPIEYYSYVRSVRSVHFAEIALLVLDPSQGIHRIDKKIAGMIDEEGRGLIIVVNKADLVPKERRREVLEQVREEFRFVPYAPVLYTSAKTGEGLWILRQTAKAVHREFHRRVSRRELTQLLADLARRHSPGVVLLGMAQVSSAPPVFRITATGKLRQDYLRFVASEIRARWGFMGVPLKFEVRVAKKPKA